MDVTQWYALALAFLTASAVIVCMAWSVGHAVHRRGSFLFHKYLYYPQVSRIFCLSGRTTRFDLLGILALLTANILCVVLKIHDRPALIQRTGRMMVINLIPLALGHRANLILDRCGVSSQTCGRIHRWLGRTVVVEGLVHAVLTVTTSRPSHVNGTSQVALWTAISTLGAILLLSPAIVRHRFYEIFAKMHLVLAACLVAALWVHNSTTRWLTSPRVYLLTAGSLWIGLQLLRLALLLHRNLRPGRRFTRVMLQSVPGAVKIHIQMARPWKFRAGQYLYLTIPRISHTAVLQSHPFAISWWYPGGDGRDVAVCIIQLQRGFTRELGKFAASEGIGAQMEMMALVEGPYGKCVRLDSYGTVLLVAKGIGIAGQLPYVRQLLDQYHACEAKCRRIALFCELDAEVHLAWIADFLNELLVRDTDYILDVHFYIASNFVSEETRPGTQTQIGDHGRIKVFYDHLNVERVLRSEVDRRKGRAIVSVCGDDSMSRIVTHVTRDLLENEVHLVDSEFQPLDRSDLARPKIL